MAGRGGGRLRSRHGFEGGRGVRASPGLAGGSDLLRRGISCGVAALAGPLRRARGLLAAARLAGRAGPAQRERGPRPRHPTAALPGDAGGRPALVPAALRLAGSPRDHLRVAHRVPPRRGGGRARRGVGACVRDPRRRAAPPRARLRRGVVLPHPCADLELRPHRNRSGGGKADVPPAPRRRRAAGGRRGSRAAQDGEAAAGAHRRARAAGALRAGSLRADRAPGARLRERSLDLARDPPGVPRASLGPRDAPRDRSELRARGGPRARDRALRECDPGSARLRRGLGQPRKRAPRGRRVRVGAGGLPHGALHRRRVVAGPLQPRPRARPPRAPGGSGASPARCGGTAARLSPRAPGAGASLPGSR